MVEGHLLIFETKQQLPGALSAYVIAFVLFFGVFFAAAAGVSRAQENIISKKEVDYVFSLTKPQWETVSKQFFAPGWTTKSHKFDTGSMVFGLDTSTGFGLSIKPFYQNDRDPPDGVMVGNYYPLGALPPMTDELKKDMEAATQKDLGPTYVCPSDSHKGRKD